MSDIVIIGGEVLANDVSRETVPALPTQLQNLDVTALLLADKRSLQTRRAYEGDLRDFFSSRGSALSPATVSQFLSLSPPEIALALAAFKAGLGGRGAAEATINRKLAALKSLLKFAHRLGLCATDGRSLVDGEKTHAYRDTRGISLEQMQKLVKLPAKLYPGKENAERRARDTSLLRLLCENGLRCDSVVTCDVEHFRVEELSLWVRLKGHGSERERITVSPLLCAELGVYLLLAGHGETSGAPLFRNLGQCPRHAQRDGGRLSHNGLRDVVTRYGEALGVPTLRPHRLRHSAITALLESGDDVRDVRRFSKHAKIETVLIYDDARRDVQGKLTNKMSKMLK